MRLGHIGIIVFQELQKKTARVTELLQATNTIQEVKVVDVTQEPFESEGPNLDEEIHTYILYLLLVKHSAILGNQVAYGLLNVSNVLLGKLCDTKLNFNILNPVGPEWEAFREDQRAIVLLPLSTPANSSLREEETNGEDEEDSAVE
ncbi:hypothetical protein GOBAR_DD10463 [Gossypium barbadense]|nr:hypothetical protein GOBAR_DD10463 [Gossypium barbadense]